MPYEAPADLARPLRLGVAGRPGLAPAVPAGRPGALVSRWEGAPWRCAICGEGGTEATGRMAFAMWRDHYRREHYRPTR